MKVYYDIEQLSAEWFEIKHGKIGGTLSKGLSTKTDTLLIQMVAEHTEPFDEDMDESFSNDDMDRGMELEPQALIELEKYTGVKFLRAGWIQSDNDLLGISPDGISECLSFACEVKCPGAKKHISTCLEDEIPLDHIHQCVHYFTVNPKLQTFYFMSYRPESIKPMFVKELNRESAVNIGTKAKPVIKTISQVVEIKLQEAERLQSQITESINKLKF